MRIPLHKFLNNEAMARAMPSSQTFDLTGLFWRRPEQKANSVHACVDGDAYSEGADAIVAARRLMFLSKQRRAGPVCKRI
jgi:hypothetical protein